MDALEMRERGAELLAAVLEPHGFRYAAGEADRGSGGLFARGVFVRDDRRIEFSARYALGEVLYHAAGATLRHEDYMRVAAGPGQHAYPGFSADPLDGFRHLASDLARFGTTFLAGSDAEFAAVAAEAARTRPPSGFAALTRAPAS
jgi:hypothetical protein